MLSDGYWGKCQSYVVSKINEHKADAFEDVEQVLDVLSYTIYPSC